MAELPPGTRGAIQMAIASSIDDAHYRAIQAQVLSRPGMAPLLQAQPALLLQAAVTLDAKADEGQLVQVIYAPWLTLVDRLLREPNTIHELDWRAMETLVASAYSAAGFGVVILTPGSGDHGRDVIATKEGFGSIRIIEQVKAFQPGYRVKADDVRALLGVLSGDRNVSKGIVTTTSEFAPGIEKDPLIQPFIPYRLELRPRDAFLEWLKEIVTMPRG